MARSGASPKIDDLLRVIAEGTASVTGDDFLYSLVRHLASALNVKYAFIAEFAGVATRVRTLAFWSGDRFIDNFEYELAATPCEAVLAGEMRLYREKVQQLFPQDQGLATIGAESFLAVPLTDLSGVVMGHLALIDVKPMAAAPLDLSIFRIFAARARAELERLRADAALKRSEERLASILATATDAIITIDETRRITLFNRAAERIFACAASWAIGQPFDRFLSKRFRGLLDDCLKSIGDPARQPQPVWAPEGLTAIRANREEFPIETTLSPLELGGRRYYTIILRDVNERQRTEAELKRLRSENVYLQEEIKAQHKVEEIIGHSPPMQHLVAQIEQVAWSDSTVLVTGETGTGKELIAHAIHDRSPRKDKMLVKLNCAALPSELIESELFGHEKGAFTGALTQRKGRFELADGGSLFLDEVGELTPPAQAKLLRVLQERSFERVGGSRTIHVDVRVIAATNRDLAEAVRAGGFRSDLFYRLNVIPLKAPPLRERRADIPLLARHFLAKFARKLGKSLQDFSPASIEQLQAYAWPGNVRELQNVVERAAVLARGPMVEIEAMLDISPAEASSVTFTKHSLEEVEREHILKVLDQAGWIIEGKDGASAALGLSPSTLRYRMQKLSIVRPR
jgi:formate hydrogenlyase transcriptional activator